MKSKDVFEFNETITVAFSATSNRCIEKPIFFVELIRVDGVVCCEASTDNQDLDFDDIDGKIDLQVKFSQMNLMPGFYYARVSIWDKEFITPLIMACRCLFKIHSDTLYSSESIFRSEIHWEKLNNK